MVIVGSFLFGPNDRLLFINLEINLAYQSTDWWIDISANVYVCADKSLFSTYQVYGNIVKTGNASAAYVRDERRVDLILTSGKIFTLYKVQHVPEVKKNLISDS